jgi:hypothetical protein
MVRILGEMGICEAILERRGNNAPPTYNRGSVPIDSIYLLHNLTIVGEGYLPFGKGLSSDHCCLWVDIISRMLMFNYMKPSRKPEP